VTRADHAERNALPHCRRLPLLLASFALVAGLAPGSVSAKHATGAGSLDRQQGRWASDGEFVRTPYSKAGHVTGQTSCAWSPMRSTLVCDQLVQSAAGDQHDTALYDFDSRANQYRYTEVPLDGSPPHSTLLTIDGDTWSYIGGVTDGKSRVLFRTTDVFSAEAEKWRSEFSYDDGKRWITMGTGISKHLGN